MSVVMRELTSGILRLCKVLYFSWDMPTFEPKTSATAVGKQEMKNNKIMVLYEAVKPQQC